MSNWCNNYLEFITKSEPKWIHAELVGDDAMPLPNEEHYAFWRDIECTLSNGLWTVIMFFQTKWSPPIDFFDWLKEDPNTLELYADYTESDNLVIGYYDMDWHHELEWPDRFYSETTDLEVYLTEPDKMFLQIEWDNYVLFEWYIREMYTHLDGTDETKLLIEEEIQECAEVLSVNLEDQQWTELIALIIP